MRDQQFSKFFGQMVRHFDERDAKRDAELNDRIDKIYRVLDSQEQSLHTEVVEHAVIT